MNKTGMTVALSAILLTACSTNGVVNESGSASKYVDYRSPGISNTVGIESQDIVSMTNEMMRDMLATPSLVNRSQPPRVVVDEKMFSNESTSRINKKLITNRLRVGLNRASGGQLVFVSRQHLAQVEKERELKRSGLVDGGTIRATQATAGVDFRLGGTITSLDTMNTGTDARSRYHQIVFEMIDMELGSIVWSGMYEFKKNGTDDAVYR